MAKKQPMVSVEEKKTMQDIVTYYDQTKFEYRFFWLNKKNRAVHFGYFDESTHTHSESLVNMNRILADTADIKKSDLVLDAGCGQGGSACWIAKNIGAKVTGITPVLSQVKKAKKFAAEMGVTEKVDFIEGDYTKTPFENNSFDVIWACESVCHADEKNKFYAEAFRLLKPGGRLVMAEYIRSSRPLIAKGERMIKEWLNGWAINDIDTGEEHEQHAKDAGFEHFVIKDITKNTSPSLKRLFIISSIVNPINMLFKKIYLRSKSQHGNVVGSIRQYQALKNNFWFYGIISAVRPL